MDILCFLICSFYWRLLMWLQQNLCAGHSDWSFTVVSTFVVHISCGAKKTIAVFLVNSISVHVCPSDKLLMAGAGWIWILKVLLKIRAVVTLAIHKVEMRAFLHAFWPLFFLDSLGHDLRRWTRLNHDI